MPTDYSKKFADLFDLLSDADKYKSELESILIGGDNYSASLEFSVGVIKFLTERLNAIAHVKPNPHEWENRYSATKAEITNEKFYNDIYGEPNIVLNNGNKISELSVNYVNKAYNYMNPNTRIGEDIKVKDRIDLLTDGEKITLNNIIKGYSNIIKVKNWVNANFSKYFDSNKMCIMPCQVGCQVGCQIAQQLPSDLGSNSCSIYPSGIGIKGIHYAYPGEFYDWYPNWETDKIHAVNSDLEQDEGPYHIDYPTNNEYTKHQYYGRNNWNTKGGIKKRFVNIFGAATKEIRDKVRAYNKEREAFNRAQIGKTPRVWKPYYSVIWLTFVLPISEEWLDSDKVIEETLANDKNGAANYYRNLPKHADWSKNGRYLFVKCENDYLITPNTSDNKFEKYQENYYRYIKYPARNNEYRSTEEDHSSNHSGGGHSVWDRQGRGLNGPRGVGDPRGHVTAGRGSDRVNHSGGFVGSVRDSMHSGGGGFGGRSSSGSRGSSSGGSSYSSGRSSGYGGWGGHTSGGFGSGAFGGGRSGHGIGGGFGGGRSSSSSSSSGRSSGSKSSGGKSGGKSGGGKSGGGRSGGKK